ncbi:MAG: M3 family metallopeptidase [Epsilonproteobacteria bacterium]|nr:M3 family metallopeptidase [Campylobacterota bacterium]
MNKKYMEDFEIIPLKLQEMIDKNNEELDLLLKIENKTYENFVVPYQLMSEKLNNFTTPIYHMDSVCNSELTQKVYDDCIPIISQYYSKLSQNENTYSAIKDIQNKYKDSLNIEQNKVLENEVRDFQLGGCGLGDDEKKQLEDIDLSLSKLGKAFSQNLLDATNSWEMVCDDDDVRGMPTDDKERAKVEIDGEVKYKFTLKMPSYVAYTTYGCNRSKREEIYKAYSTRAPENGKLIEEILVLKDKKAKILGFENYSVYSLATKMANSSEEVIEFLKNIASKSKEKAKQELEELKEYAKKLDNLTDFESYDFGYYSQKLKEEKYDIDEEFYKPYFEKELTLKGVFHFIYEIFEIEFRETNEESWNEKVLIYEIFENGNYIGKIYLDLEARFDKKGGAWMHNWHNRYLLKDELQYPTAFIVCNFPASTDTTPSLLSHDEVTTLFHELGHAIHHLFTKVNEPFVSGINGVTWDTVEFPSQFLEYFAYEKDILKMFAKHYQTEEVLDDASIEKLIKTRNYGSALSTIRQVEFALFDYLLYQKPRTEEEVQELLDSVREEFAVIIPPKYNKFQNGFSHIFSGGYAAGYYSYKWAEVLSADAFYFFKENGILNIEIGKKFKNIILGKGGSIDMNELFFFFANKKPDVESLLKIDGIIS